MKKTNVIIFSQLKDKNNLNLTVSSQCGPIFINFVKTKNVKYLRRYFYHCNILCT